MAAERDFQQGQFFPSLLELKRPEAIAQYSTLASFLADRPEPFWQEVVQRAETPASNRRTFANPTTPHIPMMALAVRALDQSVIDRSLYEKFIYFYNYTIHHQSITIRDQWDKEINKIFPMREASHFSATQAIKEDVRDRERFTRFRGYMDALTKIQASGRPNVLLTISRHGGRYTEFDFWVETQVKELTAAGQQVQSKDLARAIPKEFEGYIDLPFFEKVKMIIASIHKSRKTYGRLPQSARDLTRELRFQLIDGILETSTQTNTLPCSIVELANQLDISRSAAEHTLSLYEQSRKKVIAVKRGHPSRPTEDTITLAGYFWEAYEALNRPGHRWEYNQLQYREIAEYISTHHSDFFHLSADALIKLANNYLDVEVAEQYEGMPIRRLASRDSASVNAAIKRDLAEQIMKGHAQNVDALISTLHLTNIRRGLARRKVRHLLRELKDEGYINISDTAIEVRRDTRILRMQIEEVLQQLTEQGYTWDHTDPALRITSKIIAARIQGMGADVKPLDITVFLNNSRKTDKPVGEKMRPVIDVISRVDELIEEGMTDPEEIIDSVRSPQQPLTRVTEAKIRAYVLKPQVIAYIEELQLTEGRNPTAEEIRDHLGLRTTKIPLKIGREIGIF